MSADVIIVGGGMTGLMAAMVLQEGGATPHIVEANEVVGGRLATLRDELGVADYGAQYFSCYSPEFKEYVDRWLADGIISGWSGEWSSGSIRSDRKDNAQRYIATGGMDRLTQYLADQIVQVSTATRAVNMIQKEKGWLIQTNNGGFVDGIALLITTPVPLALTLLAQSGVHLPGEVQTDLNRIQYGKSLVGIFDVTGELVTGRNDAIQRRYDDYSWIVDNYRKGISDHYRITIQSSPEYARQHWAEPDDDILYDMTLEVEPLLRSGKMKSTRTLKRWEYAVPITSYPQDYYMMEGLPPLALAGDAYGGRGRVEGAALSGISVARALLETGLF